MKKGENVNKNGFTIIEVALVLAIAGLIFLMVFVALPGLRASQRDAERRDDVIAFLTNVKKYQTNNRGALPVGTAGDVSWDVSWETNSPVGTSWAGFYYGYLGKEFMDPVGEHYKLSVIGCGASSSAEGSDCAGNELSAMYDSYFPNDYRMIIVTQASCYGEKAVSSSNPRKIAVLYRLEGSGVYCNNT